MEIREQLYASFEKKGEGTAASCLLACKTQQVTCVPSDTSGKEERILAIMAEIRQVPAAGAV